MYVAVICSDLQCVAVLSCVLQCDSARTHCEPLCAVTSKIHVLQCVAVCCSVLQCVAGCCSVLQCVALCYIVLQCDSARTHSEPLCAVTRQSHMLQCVAVCCSVLQCVTLSAHAVQSTLFMLQCIAVRCSVLHRGTECCSGLQFVAALYSMLRCDSVRTHSEPLCAVT